MKRQRQFLLIGSTVALSWLWMQAVHELGHVIGAAVSGGRVAEVVLHPAKISYTRLAANPHPQFVAWAGPILGAVLPLLLLAIMRAANYRGSYLFQFFAGFCLVSNGAYLAAGSILKMADAGDLLRHGTLLVLLWLFGLITIPVGLWLWNGLGPYFGIGPNAREINAREAYIVLALLLITIGLELALA